MEVLQIKEITLKISIPIKDLQQGKTFKVKVKDDANFIETLATVDKYIYENPSESIFPIHEGYIHNYLQFIVNVEDNYIYDDVGISPYAPNEEGLLRKFNPIRDDIFFSLYPDTMIDVQQDFGCGGQQVKNRLEIGRFKSVIREKYGKENEYFSHYFKKK